MKKKVFQLAVSLAIIFSFISCNNTTDKASKSDSIGSNVKKDTIPIHENYKSNMNAFIFASKTMGAMKIQPRQIDTPTQGTYIRAYKNAPAFIDQSGEPILGFMIDTARDASGNCKDFQSIIHTPGIDNIYIQLGIKGSFTDADGQLRNIYTLMFVPIGKDRKPISTTPTIGTATILSSAYDVACPCINGKGCCPGN